VQGSLAEGYKLFSCKFHVRECFIQPLYYFDHAVDVSLSKACPMLDVGTLHWTNWLIKALQRDC